MPKKSKGNKVKKAQVRPNILKRKKTKVGKDKRKMKTRGRIVSRKGSKKKLLAFGNNRISAYASPPRYSSELNSEEERARERETKMTEMRAKIKNRFREGKGGENFQYWYGLRDQSF